MVLNFGKFAFFAESSDIRYNNVFVKHKAGARRHGSVQKAVVSQGGYVPD